MPKVSKRRTLKKKTGKAPARRKPKSRAKPRLGAKLGSKPKLKSKPRPAPKPKARKEKPVGRVAHFYNHIGVAIVRFNRGIRAGTELSFRGATTDFSEAPKSMQVNHKPVAAAPKGKQVGVKVKKRVREGDLVYLAG